MHNYDVLTVMMKNMLFTMTIIDDDDRDENDDADENNNGNGSNGRNADDAGCRCFW